MVSIICRPGIHGPSSPVTDRSELVRDFQFFLGPGPVRRLKFFAGPGPIWPEISNFVLVLVRSGPRILFIFQALVGSDPKTRTEPLGPGPIGFDPWIPVVQRIIEMKF